MTDRGPDSSALAPAGSRAEHGTAGPGTAAKRAAPVVCHCRQVSYEAVEEVIEAGLATSLSDLQRRTTACTRCFGCRFELELMLEDRLGPGFERSEIVTLPVEDPPAPSRWTGLRRRILGRSADPAAPGGPLPRRMYMPVLEGYRGHEVRTRAILFNSFDEQDERSGRRPEVSLRADLLALDGSRLGATQVSVEPRHSAVLEVGDMAPSGGLPDGIGVLKLVIDATQLGSFRPYFHLVSPGGITSTHEKAAPRATRRAPGPRPYFWLLPVGFGTRPEEAFIFLTATQTQPLDRHELVWQPEHGPVSRAPLPKLGLDQSACVALHEHFPAVASGEVAGTVRIEPNAGVPAGFMLRLDPERDLWRIQHL
jgi:bacterioferritin-associated ferredoxin